MDETVSTFKKGTEQNKIDEQKEAAAPATSALGSVPRSADVEEIWKKAVEQVRAARPLILGWVEAARPLGIEGRFFLLGFPPEQKIAMESLASARTRDFLETLVKDISGQELKMKMSVKEGLPPAPVLEPARSSTDGETKKGNSQAHFKDDPLIREALEIFKGQIKNVNE